MHKISVIIPIYNVGDYLSACLESVLHQSYPDLEIILVDDGSTDACPQICDEYAEKDPRIKVIHQKNGGLSEARNSGLKIATGEFISFVDSDDLLSRDFYQRLIDIILKYDADIAECGFYKFEDEDEFVTKEFHHRQDSEVLYETEGALEGILLGTLSVVVWNKIYKKEVIFGLNFPVNRINEDEYWTYKVFGKAHKIVKTQDLLYFYRQQSSSIMGKGYTIKRLDGLQAHEERILYMKEHFPSLENLAIKVYCFISMYHYHQITLQDQIDTQKNYRRNIYNKIKQFHQWSILSKWHWKDMVWFQLYIWSPKYYMKLRNYMDAKIQAQLKQVNG